MTVPSLVTPAWSRDVHRGELDGTTVLFHSRDRRLHVLNASAAAVWDGLARPTSFGELCVDLADRFGVAAADLRTDVERTIDRFRADGLVGEERVPARRPPSIGARPAVTRALTVEALDTRIEICVDDPQVTVQLRRLLAPLTVAGPGTAWVSVQVAATGDARVVTSAGGDEHVGGRVGAVLRALAEVNNVAVAGSAQDLVLHAGAVEIDGRAVLLPGGSNHGKSTLTTALVLDGAGYLTDEAARVDSTLSCARFAKRIALDPGSFPLFPQLAPNAGDELERLLVRREWHIDPRTVGRIGRPAPVHAVICPHWRAGSTTRIERLGPEDALHTLLGNAFDFAVGGEALFHRLTRLAAEVPVYRLGYGELDEAVAAVRRLTTEVSDAGGVDGP